MYVGIESEDGEVIFRQDLTGRPFLDGETTTLPVSFTSTKVPFKYVLWPHQKDKDWLERIDIKL
jgi:hypothetical protein